MRFGGKGDLRGAADILADIDVPAWEAVYRSVRATRYLREAEGLQARVS